MRLPRIISQNRCTRIVAGGGSPSENVLVSVCIVLIAFVTAHFNIVFGKLILKRIALRKAEKNVAGKENESYETFEGYLCGMTGSCPKDGSSFELSTDRRISACFALRNTVLSV